MTADRESHLLTQLATIDVVSASDAYTQLYNRHYRRLTRSAATFGWMNDVPEAICAEIAHDALEQLWTERATPPAPPLGAYLYAIAKRRILNANRNARTEDRCLPEHYARAGYTRAYDDEGNPLWSGPLADARALRLEIYEGFGRCVSAMTPQRRGVLVDHYCDECSVAESAESRGVAPATIKKLRYLGGKVLCEAMIAAGHDDTSPN